ncbi:MAG TPA: substrate-binding domain-containing protein, partial [Candidatus Dormibacteraeota bacterium]|nr:substrate-binding domain-containing protein [Candidatus Dormibacteraeota bacterium]
MNITNRIRNRAVRSQISNLKSQIPKAITLLSILGLVLLSGCGKKEADTTAPASGPSSGDSAGKKLKLAFVSNNAANFWTIARRGCEAAEKQLGNVEVMFRIPSTGSAAEQVQILDDLLAAGTDGIAVSPVDPA